MDNDDKPPQALKFEILKNMKAFANFVHIMQPALVDLLGLDIEV